MIPILRTLLAALIIGPISHLSAVQAGQLLTPDELRDAAYAGKVDEVEQAFVTAQAAFVNREISADDMRRLGMVLTVSHPKMASLTEEWLRRYPGSPYAHAVQAWLYNDIAWNIRGPSVIGETYPDAISEFYAWHQRALEHAMIAYEAEPRHVHASDAIITFANGAGNDVTAFQTLDAVMSTDPNMGTLRRALWLTAPGWGGNEKQARRMCETYAPGLESKIDPVTECLLDAWRLHHWRSMAEWAYGVVGSTNNPDLAYYRMYGILNSWAWDGEDDVRFTFEYLANPDVIWTKAAEAFDFNFPDRYGYPFIYEAHLRKALADARKQLEHDPYNPDLIDRLRVTLIPDIHRDSLGQPIDDNALRLSREEEKELVGRQLVASPYESRHWWDMSDILAQEIEPHESLSLDPYWVNAVVYSNHSMWEVRRLMQHKQRQYEYVQNMSFGKVDGDGYDMTRDVDNDIICPLIRAQRLYEKICPATTDEDPRNCEYSKYEQADLDAIWADVAERKICAKERFAPVSWLKYTPVPVDIKNLPGG